MYWLWRESLLTLHFQAASPTFIFVLRSSREVDGRNKKGCSRELLISSSLLGSHLLLQLKQKDWILWDWTFKSCKTFAHSPKMRSSSCKSSRRGELTASPLGTSLLSLSILRMAVTTVNLHLCFICYLDTQVLVRASSSIIEGGGANCC